MLIMSVFGTVGQAANDVRNGIVIYGSHAAGAQKQVLL
jgi:hypothetical protein